MGPTPFGMSRAVELCVITCLLNYRSATSSNETEDQRPMVIGRTTASKVWKSSKTKTRSGQRFAASRGCVISQN
jgi:hypothetical protein